MLRLSTILLLSVHTAFAAGIAPAEYAARRARVAKEIGPNAMLVVFSARPKIHDNDIEYPFRQSDSMLYLTGISEADTTLVLLLAESEYREVLFVRGSNPRQEMDRTHSDARAGHGDQLNCQSRVTATIPGRIYTPAAAIIISRTVSPAARHRSLPTRDAAENMSATSSAQ